MRIKAILFILLFTSFFTFNSCIDKTGRGQAAKPLYIDSVLIQKAQKLIRIKAEDLIIEKELLYDKYTLGDTYPYGNKTREFQWEKIRQGLALLENFQQEFFAWGILQNYRNNNGEAPLVKSYKRNEYNRISDTLGVERFQGIPLFLPADTTAGERYGRDGALVKLFKDNVGDFRKITTLDSREQWLVPAKYVKPIHDTVQFKHVVFVDRKNENIVTLEKVGSKWMVRSMNPATTGLRKPPYQQETPLGAFVIQEKKSKMYFYVDGTTRNGGFAPYANRFTNGGYIHGVPVNAPRTALIEYSYTLGTTPRSHMCVRNATSHAKFVYDWGPTEETIVFVIE
ncbi:murein L,D-transpeptidase [Dysgonomonas sp. 521]|nr:L,D-transpeptidase [Dysgonomonas sp. 521]NDV95489.1 murein L,D-transpeptidase [Dysgonomonas sp. 521]